MTITAATIASMFDVRFVFNDGEVLAEFTTAPFRDGYPSDS